MSRGEPKHTTSNLLMMTHSRMQKLTRIRTIQGTRNRPKSTLMQRMVKGRKASGDESKNSSRATDGSRNQMGVQISLCIIPTFRVRDIRRFFKTKWCYTTHPKTKAAVLAL